MKRTKKRLSRLNNSVNKKLSAIESREGDSLSTREKLEKLVNRSLKNKSIHPKTGPTAVCDNNKNFFTVKDFFYPLHSKYGKVTLDYLFRVTSSHLAVISGDNRFLEIDPSKLLFFDTETTGLSGGTGTIPFMLGFGYFGNNRFRAKIFILNDLSREDEFLEIIDSFLAEHDFSATVTYNGKGFDFPLMETRYILQRRRFPLLTKPHLDFLFPARTIWKNTFESRQLGFLGDVLLGISRKEDVDGSQIPGLYFRYLYSNQSHLLDSVIDHNALDLVGLAALVLLSVNYLEDISITGDEGEVFGMAMIYEKAGFSQKAVDLYCDLQASAAREEIRLLAIKRLAVIKKREKLYHEAVELWEVMGSHCEHNALRDLAVHYEHRQKDYRKALEYAEKGMALLELTEAQMRDFKKRLQRLKSKINTIEEGQ